MEQGKGTLSKGIWRSALVTALGFAPLVAMAGDRVEFAPELDILYKLNKRTRLLFVGSLTQDNGGDRTDSEASLFLDYRENRYLSTRIGYGHFIGLQTDGGDEKIEDRISGDFTMLVWPSKQWTVSVRNRIEARYVNSSSPKWRFRSRVRTEGLVRLGNQPLGPYGSFEVFMSGSGGGISRYRTELGLNVPVARQFIPSLYFGWQSDRVPNINQSVTFGLVLQFIL